MVSQETASAEITEITKTMEKVLDQPFSWEKLAYALLIFLVCLAAMKLITRFLDKAVKSLGVEKGLHSFIRSIARVLLWLVTIIIVLGYLGVEVTSLVALLSVIGLAISLAVQGILTNVAGGIMLLMSKPFKIGDYIQTGGVEGVVDDISMGYTRIKTFDNKMIFVPNGEISKEKIINFTGQETRRVDLTFSVPAHADPQVVKSIMRSAIDRNSMTLFTPEPVVCLSKINDNSVNYTMRSWCATADYWKVYYDLLEGLWDDFAAAGIKLTGHPQHLHLDDSGEA